MTITIDTNSDFGRRFLPYFVKTEHYYIVRDGSGEMEALRVYSHNEEELLSVGVWWMPDDSIIERLRLKFSDDQITEIMEGYHKV